MRESEGVGGIDSSQNRAMSTASSSSKKKSAKSNPPDLFSRQPVLVTPSSKLLAKNLKMRRRTTKLPTARVPPQNLAALTSRLAALGLELFEPALQDGRRCQYLAVLDQLVRFGALPSTGRDAARLESDMIAWLEQHQDDVTGVHGARGDAAEVALLRHGWTDADFVAVVAGSAEGDHLTLAALLAMLKEVHGIHAEAFLYHWAGEAYDGHIRANDIYGIVPAITVFLGYTGLGYTRWM